jgi:hypothetical protein
LQPSEEERLKIAEASGIPIVSYRPVARKLLDDSGIAEDIVLEAPHKKAKKNRQFELPDLLWSSEFALGFESFALYDRVRFFCFFVCWECCFVVMFGYLQGFGGCR